MRRFARLVAFVQFKNVKIVKLQAETCNFTKSITPPRMFSTFFRHKTRIFGTKLALLRVYELNRAMNCTWHLCQNLTKGSSTNFASNIKRVQAN